MSIVHPNSKALVKLKTNGGESFFFFVEPRHKPATGRVVRGRFNWRKRAKRFCCRSGVGVPSSSTLRSSAGAMLRDWRLASLISCVSRSISSRSRRSVSPDSFSSCVTCWSSAARRRSASSVASRSARTRANSDSSSEARSSSSRLMSSRRLLNVRQSIF